MKDLNTAALFAVADRPTQRSAFELAFALCDDDGRDLIRQFLIHLSTGGQQNE